MSKIHTVAKGETLLQIAKKYGHKDDKAIWKAPENKALVGKRKKPEDLQPGDKVVIPPNEQEARKVAAEVAALNAARNGNAALRAAMVNEVARAQRKVKVFEDLIADSAASTQHVLEELDQNLKGLKKVSAQVDAAAAVALTVNSMKKSIVKIGENAIKSATANGAALKKLGEESLGEIRDVATDLAKEHVQDASIHALSTQKESASKVLAFAGTVAESWDKMTSPTFWASAYIAKFEEGKSFSEAMTVELGDGIEEQIAMVKREGEKSARMLREHLSAAQTQVAESQVLVKEAEARIRWNEQEAAKLA